MPASKRRGLARAVGLHCRLVHAHSGNRGAYALQSRRWGNCEGHLVREIDALGGLMGRAIDATGIQFKLLNRSRGPAVWSPRAQADKPQYSQWVRTALENEPNIEWILGRAGRIVIEGGRIRGLAARGWPQFSLQSVGYYDRDIPQRLGPCRPRAASGWPSG